jgi:hypothetical protein
VEQKDLFEASAHRLPYVECSPNGRNAPQASVCRKKNIGSYPTWEIGGRMIKGVLSPERLAMISGYTGKQEE